LPFEVDPFRADLLTSVKQIVFGDPLDRLWKTSVFGLCGVSSVIRRMVGPITGSTASQRAEWLLEVERVVAGVA
jgi:NAD(P)H dehydrogenase (quinone)